MFIQYDEYQLLELFESEPVYIADERAGILMYSKQDDNGFKLILTISAYENECNLSLIYGKYSKPIVEMNVKDVEKINTTDNELKILQRANDKYIALKFKPSFSIYANTF